MLIFFIMYFTFSYLVWYFYFVYFVVVVVVGGVTWHIVAFQEIQIGFKCNEADVMFIFNAKTKQKTKITEGKRRDV